jgi:hypothetical protein
MDNAIVIQPNRPRSGIAQIPLLIAVAAISGCSDHVSERPSVQAVSGVWVLDSAEIWSAKQSTAINGATIELCEDGSFRAHDILRLWNMTDGVDRAGIAKTASGRWGFEREAEHGWWEVCLYIDSEDENPADFLKGLWCIQTQSEIKLKAYLGDPDQNEYIIFRRDNEKVGTKR